MPRSACQRLSVPRRTRGGLGTLGLLEEPRVAQVFLDVVSVTPLELGHQLRVALNARLLAGVAEQVASAETSEGARHGGLLRLGSAAASPHGLRGERSGGRRTGQRGSWVAALGAGVVHGRFP